MDQLSNFGGAPTHHLTFEVLPLKYQVLSGCPSKVILTFIWKIVKNTFMIWYAYMCMFSLRDISSEKMLGHFFGLYFFSFYMYWFSTKLILLTVSITFFCSYFSFLNNLAAIFGFVYIRAKMKQLIRDGIFFKFNINRILIYLFKLLYFKNKKFW